MAGAYREPEKTEKSVLVGDFHTYKHIAAFLGSVAGNPPPFLVLTGPLPAISTEGQQKGLANNLSNQPPDLDGPNFQLPDSLDVLDRSYRSRAIEQHEKLVSLLQSRG